MLTEDWCKFHAITFCGGNINALYTPGIAIEQPDVSELLKYDGARTIKCVLGVPILGQHNFRLKMKK